MIDRSGDPTYSYKNPTMGEQYLYLLKRIDQNDSLTPSSYQGKYRMKIVDSVRYDTVKPKLMVISQAFSGKPDQYVYVYETYFDNPIEIDSVFYIHGTKKKNIIRRQGPMIIGHFSSLK